MRGMLCSNIHTVCVRSARVYWGNASWVFFFFFLACVLLRWRVSAGAILAGIFGVLYPAV